MKIARRVTELQLDHCPYHLRGMAKGGDVFIASSQEGDASIFGANGEILTQLRLDRPVQSIGGDYERRTIAYADQEGLRIIDFDGQLLQQYEGNYNDILIQNEQLWAVKIMDHKYAFLEMYDLVEYKKRASKRVEDMFGQSAYMLFPGFDENSIVLWMAAGQDGQINCVVRALNGELQLTEVGHLDTHPISISPNGKSFVNGNNESFEIFSYPALQSKKRISLEEEFQLIENVCYIDEYQLLVQLSDQIKIYNIRFDSMDDVFLCKNGSNEKYACSSFLHVSKLGNHILLPTRENTILLADQSSFDFRPNNQLDLLL